MRNLSLLAVLLASACVHKADNTDTAEGAIDSQESVESEGNLMMASVDGADMTGLVAYTSDQVAARIALNVTARWSPSGCATATATGSNIVVTYHDCTGPRGLVHVTGELDLAVAVALDGTISVHGTATNLEVNAAVLTIDANATYGVSGTNHTLAVQTNGSGIGPLGNEIDHKGNYTITWDTSSMCRSIAGMWSTEITTATASATRSNDVNLMRCAGGCPTGTVTHHFLLGSSVTVTFDGTNIASWTTSTGKSGTVKLACQ